jgi:hypothetical protein
VNHCGVETTGLKGMAGSLARCGRRDRSHVVLTQDSLDEFKTRLASRNHKSGVDPVKPIEAVTADNGIGQIPAIRPDPGSCRNDAIPHPGGTHHCPGGRDLSGNDVTRQRIRSKEVTNLDPEGPGQSQRRIHPGQVPPRLNRTDQLPADAGPFRQLGLGQPGELSEGLQTHASNLA